MTRLIDADALRDDFAERMSVVPIPRGLSEVAIQHVLRDAPTICCERCKHDQYCYRTLEWHIFGGRRDKHYPSACDLFQPQAAP